MITHFAHAGRATLGARDGQEDAHGFSVLKTPARGDGDEEHALLAVVADGMGGHAAGEVASRLAVDEFLNAMAADGAGLDEATRKTALHGANESIARHIAAQPQCHGMGCTLLAAIFSTDGLRWLSVGDSLLYLFRDGRLTRLNEDHSMATVLDEWAENGLMDRDEARTSPRRHHLLSALTGGHIEMVDAPAAPKPLRIDDWVLLASDGLEVLPTGVLESLLWTHRNAGAEALVDTLLTAVADARDPFQDNTTVFAVRACATVTAGDVVPTIPLASA